MMYASDSYLPQSVLFFYFHHMRTWIYTCTFISIRLWNIKCRNFEGELSLIFHSMVIIKIAKFQWRLNQVALAMFYIGFNIKTNFAEWSSEAGIKSVRLFRIPGNHPESWSIILQAKSALRENNTFTVQPVLYKGMRDKGIKPKENWRLTI